VCERRSGGSRSARSRSSSTTAPWSSCSASRRSGSSDLIIAARELGQHRSTGQATIFSFRTGKTFEETAIADGIQTRLSPQGYAYVGPVGVLAEYVRSTQAVRLDDTVGDVTFWAWQVQGSFVVTGESASYKGVTPAKPVGQGGYGALELVARYSELNPEATAFGFADIAKSVDRARSFGVGTNTTSTARSSSSSTSIGRASRAAPRRGTARPRTRSSRDCSSSSELRVELSS
jgi:hypothetical protein